MYFLFIKKTQSYEKYRRGFQEFPRAPIFHSQILKLSICWEFENLSPGGLDELPKPVGGVGCCGEATLLGLQEASSQELVLELSFLGQHPSKAKVCEEVTSGFRRLSLTSTGLGTKLL